MKLTVKAYAKINLLLDILGSRPDGYHELFMIMQSVGLFDTVTVETAGRPGIEISADIPDIPTGRENIAYKAAEAFFAHTGISDTGLKIGIEKRIPHAAGLAGGSADGAAVIVALRKMFAPDLSFRDVIEIGAKVGSDVPFCSLGGTMAAQGRGTILTCMPNLEMKNILIVKPEISVSTGRAYSAFDEAESIHHPDCSGAFSACLGNDKKALYSRVANVFEQFIDVPQRVDIKSVMRRHGAACSCMSGSGPSVFGIFESSENAKKCLAELKQRFPQSFLVPAKPMGVEVLSGD